MKVSRLAIVIPAYNEAATISTVVANALSLGDVIVVNDGSRDSTADRARAAGAKVVNLGGNTGYEGALNSGVQSAVDQDYDFVLTMDADGQHSIESAQVLLNVLGSADIGIGTRQKKQRAAEWIAGWIGGILWGVADPYSGLKIYRLKSCKAFMPFDSRCLVGGEMFVRAHRAGLKIVTVPIETEGRTDAPRFDSSWRANCRLSRATVLLAAITWGVLR
jgi:glycosyltransferase involved in cell wall biosynthesis